MAAFNRQIVDPFNMTKNNRHSLAEITTYAQTHFATAFAIINDPDIYHFETRDLRAGARSFKAKVLHVGSCNLGAQEIFVFVSNDGGDIKFFAGPSGDVLINATEPFPKKGSTKISDLRHPFHYINGRIPDDVPLKQVRKVANDMARNDLNLLIKFAFLLEGYLFTIEHGGIKTTLESLRELCLHIEERKNSKSDALDTRFSREDSAGSMMSVESSQLSDTPTLSEPLPHSDLTSDRTVKRSFDAVDVDTPTPLPQSRFSLVSPPMRTPDATGVSKFEPVSDRFVKFTELLSHEYNNAVQDGVQNVLADATNQAERIEILQGEVGKLKEELDRERIKTTEWMGKYMRLQDDLANLVKRDSGEMEGIEDV